MPTRSLKLLGAKKQEKKGKDNKEIVHKLGRSGEIYGKSLFKRGNYLTQLLLDLPGV